MRIRSQILPPILMWGLFAFLLSTLMGGISFIGLLKGVDLWGYDQLIAWRGVDRPASQIVIIDFDDTSVEKYNAFPIPRYLLREIIEKISVGRPDLIGVDVLLDRARDAEDDVSLAQTLTKSGNIILAEVFGSDQIPEAHPLKEFKEAALASGFVNLPKDNDGLVRRVPLVARTHDYEGISFSAALATNYLGYALEPYGPGLLRLGEKEIPVDSNFATLINRWGPPPARSYSVEMLLSEDFDTTVFEGKIVVIGNSSIAAKDLYDTPVSTTTVRGAQFRRQLSGAEIHVAAAATLITGKAIFPMPLILHWIIGAGVFWICFILIEHLRPYYTVLVVFLGALGVFSLALYLFTTHRVWFPFMGTEIGIGLVWPIGLGYGYSKVQRVKMKIQQEKRLLMGLFEQYMSTEVATEILRQQETGGLSSETRTATVLFSDIRNFTSMTSGMPPDEVVSWLNKYFTRMGEVIRNNNGFLNKFMGDGMLVVFGVPHSNGIQKDAENAVLAAQEMLKAVTKHNADKDSGGPEIAIGIGIHTGSLTVGNVGTADRLEYSVIGETVNIASRLESMTKTLGEKIIFGPETMKCLGKEFETRPLGEKSIRGLSGKIQLFTLD